MQAAIDIRRGAFLVLVGLTVTGCASIQAGPTRTMEQMLDAAGFEIRVAETPEALAQLQALPARKLLVRPQSGEQSGEQQYAYADPTGCHCLYVGTEQNYQELRNLQQQARVTAERAHAVETHAAFDGLWRGIWPPPLQ